METDRNVFPKLKLGSLKSQTEEVVETQQGSAWILLWLEAALVVLINV